MEIIENPFADCYVLKPRVLKDDRGYFYESFNVKSFKELTGLALDFVQDNQSFSKYGVIRGLHAQLGEHAQAKLVRVLDGNVLDVIVDGRPDSSTFGKSYAIELSAQNKLQLFVPRGFYHGFSVLSKEATFFYKCDNYYHSASESGVNYADPELAIDWKIDLKDQILTEKDRELPFLNQLI